MGQSSRRQKYTLITPHLHHVPSIEISILNDNTDNYYTNSPFPPPDPNGEDDTT